MIHSKDMTQFRQLMKNSYTEWTSVGPTCAKRHLLPIMANINMYVIFKDCANNVIMMNNLHGYECAESVIRRIEGNNKARNIYLIQLHRYQSPGLSQGKP